MSIARDSPPDSVPITARKAWRVREVEQAAARRLADALGLHPVTGRILSSRGIETQAEAERFLQPGLDELHSPFAFREMEAAVERVNRAIASGERIAVHGDYDVDGISGSVLLATVLEYLGGKVEVILPHRVHDGYGLNPSGIDRAQAAGAGLLVAVDCGITAIEACEHAAVLGIDVIIVDHHLPQAGRPKAVAILNPRMEDSGYPEPDLAAVGVAFKLARALLERSPRPAKGLSMLRLVALGTIADLVPLRGENRVMAIHGLAALADTGNAGLLELLRVAKVDRRAVSAGDVAFRLAPRINAAGRIGHPDVAAELFLTSERSRARALAVDLDRFNGERQELERRVTAEALASPLTGDGPITVVAGENWHRGVIGIVAARLVEHTGRPAVVISIESETAFGSARSVPGFDITGALTTAAGLLDNYGGHRQAAGFTIAAARVDELRAALVEHAEGVDPDSLRAEIVCDDELDIEEATLALAAELERLAPFGIGNPRPRFLCLGARLAEPARLIKDEHVKLRLRSGDDVIDAMAWRRPDLYPALSGVERIDFVARLKVSSFRGRTEAQFEIEDVRS